MAVDRELTERIKEFACEVGFDAVGVAPAGPFPDDRAVVQQRIADGHYSGLPWFTAARADIASDPRNLLPTARSLISVALSYRPDGAPAPDRSDGPRGRISAYAWGRDYHRVLKERMEQVVTFIREAAGPTQQARTLVDTARILDRAAARRAGVGWVGKHTNVITKAAGSWVFLGEILTELELAPDAPLRTNCGACDLCLRACPTGAIVAPYTVDNNRCISYLTIEHKGIIPRELRPLMGTWVFGCDVCQEVCPPNRRVGEPADAAFRAAPDGEPIDGTPELIPLLRISAEDFTRRFGHTPVKRAKCEGLQRNAAIALGNSGDPAAVPALAAALRDGTPLVRAHAAWALGRLATAEALQALRDAALSNDDPLVRDEIDAALGEACHSPSPPAPLPQGARGDTVLPLSRVQGEGVGG